MTLILEDVFTVEFNVDKNNKHWFIEILEDNGVKIIKNGYKSKLHNIECQHEDYNILLFATHLYLDSLEKRLKLEKIL